MARNKRSSESRSRPHPIGYLHVGRSSRLRQNTLRYVSFAGAKRWRMWIVIACVLVTLIALWGALSES